jgi:hypothetical protein
MISDPKTTPDSRVGRLLFAALVAAGAYYVQFRLFRTNGLLWSLALCSLVVPILDWRFPGERYVWSAFAAWPLRRDRLRQPATINRPQPATDNPQPVEVPHAPLPDSHSPVRVPVGVR